MVYTRKGPFPGPQYTDYDLFEAFDAGIYNAHDVIDNDVTPARAFMEKVEAAYADPVIVVTGDSTTVTGTPFWPQTFATLIGQQWPTHKVLYYLWNTGTVSYGTATTIQTGSPGTRTISVYNCGVGSTTAQYPLAGSRLEGMILTPNPDVLIINHGHNHSSVYQTSWAQLSAFTETITQHLPDAQLFLMAQNPRSADNVSEVSNQVTHNLGRERGYGVIDVYSRFKANATWTTDWMQDTIHPNSAGAAQMAAEAFRHFKGTNSTTHSPQPSQQPSSLTLGGENLLYNGDFAIWPALTGNTAPTGWTRYLGTGSSSVLETSTTAEQNSPSLRLRTTTSNNNIWFYQALDATQRARIAGRRITLAWRVYVASANQTGSSAVQPLISWSAGASQVASAQTAFSSTNQAYDRWVWVTQTYDVPSSVPSDLTVGINCVNSSGIIDVIVDRASMTFGSLPVEWRPTASEERGLLQRYTIPIKTGWYVPPPYAPNVSTLSTVSNRLYMIAVWVPRAVAIDRIGVNITVAGTGGTPVLRLGAYYDDGAGLPGALIFDAGTVDASAAAIVQATVAQTLPAGWSWLACVPQGATTTQPTVTSLIGQQGGTLPQFVSTTAAGFFSDSQSGALPSPFPSSPSAAGNVPRVMVRAA